MTATGATDVLRILNEAAETVASAREAEMPQADWDSFESLVHRMQAALDRGDLAEVPALRQDIEQLDWRQSAAAAPGQRERVTQPERLRTASENLSQQLEALKAARSARDAERGR